MFEVPTPGKSNHDDGEMATVVQAQVLTRTKRSLDINFLRTTRRCWDAAKSPHSVAGYEYV